MASHVSARDTLAAFSLLGWALAMWFAIGALALADRRRRVGSWTCRATVGLIVVGLAGQLGHVQEHVAQVGYWVQNPDSPGWMTPWGMGLARGLGQVDPTKPALGMEILHLVGNLIFLAGLVAVMLITRRASTTRARRWARMGTWMQSIHGLEHLSLTLSVALGAPRAVGLSTWFGTMHPGPGLWTYRVWWHFVANVLGSAVFAITAWHLWHERRVIDASYRDGIATTPANSGGSTAGVTGDNPVPIRSSA
jgi:hypothetical protein